MTPGQALGIVLQILKLARCFERDDLAWQPQPEDFLIEPNGDLVLSQARAVGKLMGQRFDVRRVLWAARELLLPHPLVGAGAEAIRFVAGRVPTGSPPITSAREAIAKLEEIRRRSMIAPPPGRVASSCDVGLLRERNEDAVAVAEGDGWMSLVVCDGVSSSSRGDIASSIGSQTASARIGKLADELRDNASDEELHDLMADAIGTAHDAILVRAKREPREPGKEPSGTTIVAALVVGDRIAVGWAGDSRAYLVTNEGGGRMITKDHSWLNHALAMGTVSEGDVVAEPLAHALTRCIGPLEIAEGGGGARPDVVVVPVEASARLVLCSDGLWCYFPTAESIAEAMRSSGTHTPAGLCQVLVDHALARGGQDNVTVALCDL